MDATLAQGEQTWHRHSTSAAMYLLIAFHVLQLKSHVLPCFIVECGHVASSKILNMDQMIG